MYYVIVKTVNRLLRITLTSVPLVSHWTDTFKLIDHCCASTSVSTRINATGVNRCKNKMMVLMRSLIFFKYKTSLFVLVSGIDSYIILPRCSMISRFEFYCNSQNK